MNNPISTFQAVQSLLAIAQSQLPVRESNNNSGAQVEEYQATTTLGGTHWPWCAAFVCWCLIQLGKKLGTQIPWSNSASCDVILADAKARGLLRDKPKPGYIFLVRARLKNGSYSNSDMIHTGIVENVDGKQFTEIAGNTNNDGSAEGVGVFRTHRVNNGRYFFVDALAALPQETPEPQWNVTVRVPQGADKPVVKSLPSKTINGSVYVAARDWAKALGKSITDDPGNQTVRINSVEVPAQSRKFDGYNYYPIRVLADMISGSFIQVSDEKRAVQVIVP